MPLHYSFTAQKGQECDRTERDSREKNGGGKSGWLELSRWLSPSLSQAVKEISAVPLSEIEEVRLRIGRPLLLISGRGEYFVGGRGEINESSFYSITHDDLLHCLDKMTQSSVYAAEEELKQGFLTLPGGHRVGVTGKVVMDKGKIQSIKHISALNIRLAKGISGLGRKILPALIKSDGYLSHTIILSMPRAGKTTLLRDLIRLISDGVPQIGLKGQNVSVVDERGELAGMWQGVPTYDLGMRTDVLDGCPKGLGMGMLIRAMAPNVLAVDELGHMDDVAAVAEALRTGVSVLSTAHAGSVKEAMERPSLRLLLEEGVFERAVLLNRTKGPGTLEGIYDLATGLRVMI